MGRRRDPLTELLAPAQRPDELGRLGGFRVLEVLGRGGMGVVFLAEDPKLRRKVAIKAMLLELAESQLALDRFLREARAAAALDHDHIVPILHVGEDRGVPFIVMPFLRGESLEDRLKRAGPVPMDLVIQVGAEIAAALAAAHGKGLLHRDIKPPNIWLESRSSEEDGPAAETAPWRVKLLDFGLARPVQTEGPDHLTQTGAILGTPGYMSPEQVDGAALDARSDLFSLGCVLYRMAAGRPAFLGNTVTARLVAAARDTPPTPAQLNPGVPAGLSELIMHLLEKNRAARPTSAADIARRLRALDLSAAAADATTLRPQPRVAAEEPPALRPPDRPHAGRRRFPNLVAVIASLAVLGGIGYWLAQPFLQNDSVEIKKDDKAKIAGPSQPPVPQWTPVPVGESPFDKLDPGAIPKDELADWQPKELVAVIGTQAMHLWGLNYHIGFTSDGKYGYFSGHGMTGLWDAATGRWLGSASHGETIQAALRKNNTFRLPISGKEFEIDFGDGPFSHGEVLKLMPEGRGTCWRAENGLTALSLADSKGPLALVDLRGVKPLVSDTLEFFGPQDTYASREFIFAAPDTLYYLGAQQKLRRATIKSAKFVDDRELPIPIDANEWPRAVRADGKVLALWKQDRLELWNVEKEQPTKLQELKGPGFILRARYALSPDGRWLVADNSYHGSCGLWRIDGPTPRQVLELGTPFVYPTAVFTPDSSRLAFCNNERHISCWDLSGEEPKNLTPLDPAKSLRRPELVWGSIDPKNGRLFAATYEVPAGGLERRSRIWDFAAPAPTISPGPQAFLDADRSMVFGLGQDRWLLSGYKSPPQRFELRDQRWLPLGKPFAEKGNWRVSADGSWMIGLVASKTGDVTLQGWHMGSASAPVLKWSIPFDARAPLTEFWRINVAPHGTHFAIAHGEGKDFHVRLYRNHADRPEMFANMPMPQNSLAGYNASWSPDGRILVHSKYVGYKQVVEDVSGPAPVELDKPHFHAARTVFSPDGKRLALFDIEQPREIAVLSMPDLERLWTWTPPGPIFCCEWAPDGRHLITINANNTAYVIRLPRGVVGGA